MRLDRYLSDMRVDTRSNLKKAIRKGAVTVDGAVVKDPGLHVEATQRITYEGVEILHEEKQYFLLNKPAGVVSATEDKHQTTVIDLLPSDCRKDLFPVGRLDKDTTGLLLITNDGDLAHRLLAPNKHVDKVYEALVQGIVEKKHVKLFQDGLQVEEDWKALPAGLEILESKIDGDKSYVRITIHEGKYHQIKRMFEAIDMEVLTLKRTSMGPLTLDENLEVGEYRRLTEEELETL